MATLDGVSLGRMALAKTFTGDLVGTGAGEMLTAGTPVKGSAGYVAIERVTGTPHLSIQVVPGSGTSELAGISGTFTLAVVEGKHHVLTALRFRRERPVSPRASR